MGSKTLSGSKDFIVVGIDVGGKDTTIACIFRGNSTSIAVEFESISKVSDFQMEGTDTVSNEKNRILVIDAPLTYDPTHETGARHLELEPGKPEEPEKPNYHSINEDGRVIKPNSFRGIGRAVALGNKFKSAYIIAETHPGLALKQIIERFAKDEDKENLLLAWNSYKGGGPKKPPKDLNTEESKKETKRLNDEHRVLRADSLNRMSVFLISQFGLESTFTANEECHTGKELMKNPEVIFKNDDYIDAFVCALVGLPKVGGEREGLSELLREEAWHNNETEEINKAKNEANKTIVKLILVVDYDRGLYLDLGKRQAA
jgi:hypothetical protein